MNIELAADIARRLNPDCNPPAVMYIGEDQLGKYYTMAFVDGRQTSFVVRPGQDLDKKVAETIGRFEAPPKCK